MSSPPLSKPLLHTAAIPPDPDPDPHSSPLKSTVAPGFLWSNLFADPSSAHVPSSSPSFLPDGTPIVFAPSSVILKASATWAGHLLCRFMGEPPSPGKFFNDLNRIWGKNGDISIRRFSSGTFLVHVPSAGTRKWILETGLWSSGTVSFVISEWSVNASLAAPPRLTSATTVLTIRDIPPQLWSHEAIARIAGGVATLIPDTRAYLPQSSLGTATIRAIVPLGSPLPSSVLVKDSSGNSVLVSVDYGKLPHLCPNCNSYGHQVHRCPKKSLSVAPNIQSSSTKAEVNPESTRPTVSTVAESEMEVDDPNTTTTELPKSHKLSSQVKSSAAKDDVITSITKANSLSSNITSSILNKPHLSAPINPESASPLSSTVGGIEMEVEGPSTMVTEQPKQPLASSPPKPLPQVKTQSIMPKEVPNPELNIGPSSSETHTNQVPPSNTSPHDPMLTVSIDTHESSTLREEAKKQSSPVVDQTQFTFPPPLSCALRPPILPPSTPESSNDSTLVQPQLETHSLDKNDRNRVKRKTRLDSKTSLRCTQISHPFKSKGVVEKRRKKINNNQIPDDEEVKDCFLEMESDKVNTLHFEVLEAYKVIRKQESANQEAERT